MMDASTTDRALQAADIELRVNDGHVVRAHFAGADGVIDGFRFLADKCHYRFFGLNVSTGEHFVATVGLKSFLGKNFPCLGDAFQHHLAVVFFAQVVGLKGRRFSLGRLISRSDRHGFQGAANKRGWSYHGRAEYFCRGRPAGPGRSASGCPAGHLSRAG